MKKHDKKAPHPTKTAREDRVVKVYKLLTQHETRTEILGFCSSEWGLRRASADNLIQKASKMLSGDLKKTQSIHLSTFLQSLRDLYREALKQGNLQVARQTIMDQAKLLGLDQHTINHIIEDKRDLADLTDEELNEKLKDAE